MNESKIDFWYYANVTPGCAGFSNINELMKELQIIAGENLPDTIEVAGYNYVKINIDEIANWIIEILLERLDEDYASYDDCGISIPTKKMKNAAREFVEKVAKEYEVDDYREVCRKTVHPKDYLEGINENTGRFYS